MGIFGRDETALGSDMGLMYKFDVDIRGFPHGCSGLHTFYPSSDRRFSDMMCGVDGQPPFNQPDYEQNRAEHSEWMDRGCPADCDRQDYRYPGDVMTLADHVERFANDQAAWVEE